jgi:adenylate cyclase class IV
LLKIVKIKITDEGHRVTMTFKSDLDNEFVTEHEVQINNFDKGCAIFTGLGCEKKYYYEKMREIYHISNTEICWEVY